MLLPNLLLERLPAGLLLLQFLLDLGQGLPVGLGHQRQGFLHGLFLGFLHLGCQLLHLLPGGQRLQLLVQGGLEGGGVLQQIYHSCPNGVRNGVHRGGVGFQLDLRQVLGVLL